MSIQLYGINNCDTVKKAKKFLDSHSIAYEFIDYKKQPPSAELVQSFFDTFGAEVLNKRSTTYRQLSDEDKQALADDASLEVAKNLLLQHNSMIKRPILISDSISLIGFKEAQYQALCD